MPINIESLPGRPSPIIIEPDSYRPVSNLYRSALIAAILLTIIGITEILMGIFVDGLYTINLRYRTIQYPGWLAGALVILVALLAWQSVFGAKKPRPRIWSLFETLEYKDGFDIVCESLDLDRKKRGLEVDIMTVHKGGVLILDAKIDDKWHQPRRLLSRSYLGYKKSYILTLKYMDKVKSARFDTNDLSNISIERLRALADRYNVTLKLTGEAGSLSKKEEDAVIPKLPWRYWGITSVVLGFLAYRYSWLMPLPVALIAIATGLIGLVRYRQLGMMFRGMPVVGIIFAIMAILLSIERLYR